MITSACATALAGLSSTKQSTSGSVNLHGARFRGWNKYAGTYPAKMSTVVLIFADGAQIRACTIVRRPKWGKGSKTESCWYRRVNEQFLQKWLRKSKRNLVAKKARTYEWVIVTYGRFLVDRRAPRVTKATCTFWSQPKARETLKKRERKFDLVLQSLSVSGTCSFCTFLIIKVFESTLLRLPCDPGRFEMSRHCREDDDDCGGPATKVPRESIDDNPTRWHTRSSLPALDLEKCLLCDSTLLKPRGTYQLSPWSLPQRFCSSAARILFYLLLLMILRKDDVWSWRIRSTSWQTFMRRKWCTMPLSTESTPAASPWTPLPLPTRRMPKVLLIIQRLRPMTATRHGLQMSYLNDRGVDHRCLLYYESIKPRCAICKASYCEMKYRKKLSEGTVWRAQSHDQKALWHEIGLSQT